VQYTSRAEALLELGVLEVVRVLGFLLGVQVVEVAEELVEPVLRRQVLVAVPEVVLAELAADVTERLQELSERGILRFQSEIGAGQANLRQSGADRRLTRQECRAASGAALLAVPVGEEATLLRDAIDVRRLVAHDAEVVGGDVVPTDVVSPDDEDVRSLSCVGHHNSCPFGRTTQRKPR
jgi:hypothetical protein